MLIKDVLLETTHPSAIAQHFLSQKKGQGVLVVGTFEGQHQMDIVGLSQVSHLTSDVGCSLALTGSVAKDGGAQLVVDEVDKFFMVLDTSCRDDDAFRGQSGSLEFLDEVGSEVVDVRSVAEEGVAEVLGAIGSLVNSILEGFISSEEGLQFMSVCVLVHTNCGGNEVLWFEGRICDHAENVHYVVSKAVSMIVTILSVEFHLEFPA